MPILETATCTLHYRDSGGEGPAVVFLHGWCDGAESWDETIAHFQGSYRCIAPDMRGHGDSGQPRDHAYFLEALSNDVVAICGAAGVTDPALVGHSFGGLLAATVAARFPGFARAVVVEDQALDLRGQAAGLRSLGDVIFGAETHMAFRTQLFDSMVSGAMPAAGRESISRLKAATPVEVGQALWAPFFAANDAELGRLASDLMAGLANQPGLIIESQPLPEYHAAVLAAAPSTRIEIVPSGHWIHLEHPTEFRAFVTSVL